MNRRIQKFYLATVVFAGLAVIGGIALVWLAKRELTEPLIDL
jgi:hypothetical protein